MSALKHQLELAQPAEADFSNLLSYTLQTWGKGQLAEYADKINAALAASLKTRRWVANVME